MYVGMILYSINSNCLLLKSNEILHPVELSLDAGGAATDHQHLVGKLKLEILLHGLQLELDRGSVQGGQFRYVQQVCDILKLKQLVVSLTKL